MLHTVQQIHYTQYNKYTTHNTTNTLHTVQQIHYTQYNRYTTHSSCQKNQSISLRLSLHTGRHLLGVSPTTSLNSNFCTSLTAQSSTNKKCIISHAQNTTALECSVYLTVIHCLMVTSKEQSVFPSVNHCQGPLQTPQ